MIENLKEIGIDHIGLIVPDRDKTITKFHEVLNIKEFKKYIFKPNKAWSNGKLIEKYELKIGMTLDNKMKGCNIEIIEPLIKDGIHREFLELGCNGIHHIAYKVENYDYWLNKFKKKNSKFIFEAETEDEINGYRRCFYAEDKILGTVYEILEKPYFRK